MVVQSGQSCPHSLKTLNTERNPVMTKKIKNKDIRAEYDFVMDVPVMEYIQDKSISMSPIALTLLENDPQYLKDKVDAFILSCLSERDCSQLKVVSITLKYFDSRNHHHAKAVVCFTVSANYALMRKLVSMQRKQQGIELQVEDDIAIRKKFGLLSETEDYLADKAAVAEARLENFRGFMKSAVEKVWAEANPLSKFHMQ